MKKYFLALVSILLVAASASAATNWKSYRIMIDPGHGGTDSGATGPSAPHEKTLALWCGSQLYANITGSSLNGYSKRINQTLSGTVKMTRSTDVFISLSSRKSSSVSYDPYIFCSIHLNAFNGTAKGTEVWYYWTTGNSNALANKVYSTLMSNLNGVSGFTATGRGVKKNGWTVITGSSSIPAILTEGLFVDNKTEWGIIKDGGTAAGFQAWAKGHLQGFYNHLKTLKADIIDPYSSGESSTPTTPTLTVDPTSVSFSCTEGETRTDKISVKQTATTAACAITISGTNAAMFSVDKSSIAKATNGTVTVTYKPTAVGSHSATITYKTGSLSKTTKLTGTCTAAPLAFTEKWNFSDKKSTLTKKTWDAGKVRNMTYRSGKLYLVYDHADIKVVNAQTGADLGNLNKKDVTGGTLTLCDVRICSGKVVACNLASKSGEKLRIYVWDDEQDFPRVAMETSNFGGATRIGDCIGWSGNWTEGKLIFGNDDGTTTRIIEYPVKNGVISATPTVVKATSDGSASIGSSSSTRVYPISSGGYWLQGKQIFVSRLDATGKRTYYVDDDVRWGNAWKTFTWKDHKYALMTTFNDMEGENWTAQTDAQKAKNYTGGRMKLLDCADGYAKAVTLGEYPSAGLSDKVQNTNCTTQCLASVTDGQAVEAWVLSTGQGIAYYVSKGDTAPTYTVTPITQKDDTPTPTPTLSANPTSATLTAQVGKTATKAITITGANLTANVTLAISGTNANQFALSASSLGTSGGSVTVTYKPTAAGSHSATLTATSGSVKATVALKGTASEPQAVVDPSKFTLTKVMDSTKDIVASAEGRYSTGYGSYIYVTDKANKQILRYDTNGNKSVFATIDGTPWTAITADDAGNILINQGSNYGTNTAVNWFIYDTSGKQRTLTLTLPSAIAITNPRIDAIGRVVGNVLSAEGGYLCLLVNTSASAAVYHIVNGAQSGNATVIDPTFTADNSSIAQPIVATTTAVAANPQSAYAFRKRGNKSATTKATATASTSDGFDTFILAGKTYVVEPTGTAYSDGFFIHELGSNEVLAEKSQTLASPGGQRFQSLTARVSADGSYAYIYQNVSGYNVAIYRYGMPSTGVDTTISDATVVDVSYYNLQGVKVNNPQSGQIYIRVNSLSDGTISTKKVIIK